MNMPVGIIPLSISGLISAGFFCVDKVYLIFCLFLLSFLIKYFKIVTSKYDISQSKR